MGNGGAALARLFLREGADPNALDNVRLAMLQLLPSVRR